MRIIHGLILLLILSALFALIVVKETFGCACERREGFGSIAALVNVNRQVDEGFGATQPGVFVQLASTHVPTAEDEEEARRYPYQVNREIAEMTGEPLF